MKIYSCRICGRDVDYDEGHGCALATPANERHRITLKERDALAAENRKLRGRLGEAERLLREAPVGRFADTSVAWHGRCTAYFATPPTAYSAHVIQAENARAHAEESAASDSPVAASTPLCETTECHHPASAHDWSGDCTFPGCTCATLDLPEPPSVHGPCPTCSPLPVSTVDSRVAALEARVAALEAWRGAQNNALAKPEAVCKHGVAMDDHCRPCEPATSADRVPMSLNKEGYEIGHQFRDNGQGWCASGCGQTQGGHNPEAAEAVPAPPEPHAFVLGEGENRRFGWCYFEPRPQYICALPKGHPIHAVPGAAK